MQLQTPTALAKRQSADAVYLYEHVSYPRELSLATLIERCAVESERFYRGQPNDTGFAYELFRRALVDKHELAWEHIYVHYSPLVESWVRRCGAFSQTGESSEFFVVSAFTRFWKAMQSKQFDGFLTLAALLHYLQLCTSCVVIDSVRAQSWAEVLPEEALASAHAEQPAPDETVLDLANRRELWDCINGLLHDAAERTIVYESFVLGMKPGDIFAQHKQLFATVNMVYNTKRNLLERLGRNQQLRVLAEI